MEVLRNDSAVRFLHVLFNAAFSHGISPSTWHKCILNPIPKSSTSDPRDPSCYRGIALASSIYKLYCGIINQRLSTWAEENNLLNDAQNGFRKGRGTVDHLCTLSSIIETRKRQKLSTFVAFIDFRKAYDSVNRQLLWRKLWDVGVRGRMFSALRSLYTDCLYSVRLNGHMTEWMEASSGLRQGCILSPLLFNLYVNDLAVVIENANRGIPVGEGRVSILMYADDIALLSEDANDLQELLNCLHDWCSRWQLNVNADKSAVIHFRTPATPKTGHVFLCGGSQLLVVEQYKYLGLIFTEFLNYDAMAEMAAGSASRALGLIIAKAKTIGGMPYQTFTKLYNSLVWPIVSYGAAVWGTKDMSRVNAVQNRACRFFLGVKRFTPNAAIQGDMGWALPSEKQWTAVTRQWHRFSGMAPDRLTRRVFDWADSTASNRVPNWNYRVRHKFEQLDIEELANPVMAASVPRRHCTETVSARLREANIAAWRTELQRVNARRGQGHNKLRTYRLFKQDFVAESYVRALLAPSHRSALAKFRCGTAPLKIETGRYERLALQDRVCFVCGQGHVESEAHVLLDCPLYQDIRNELFAACSRSFPDFELFTKEDKLCTILASDKLTHPAAKACKHILNRRATFLFR